ncbi:ATP-binding protein [Roseomonas fluvialis]|uniref:LuxR family transcriptional regulator n=1 Tax=Roseomonas fluvialis TaxID=1750527 RepID=A0ABM7XYA4_9PROT|nr:tetratricopeptide repeat protein [Roseomonas fluvialis]BDG70478.1 LuxR family transcriptional regulator [Roseomonas fluvialis]
MRTNDPHWVTLLFTDVEGSTRLLRKLGDEAYTRMHADLSATLRRVFKLRRGRVLDSQGDSFFVAFARSPLDAVAAAIECQASLAATPWPGAMVVRVRIGMHTALVRRADPSAGGGYVGLDVHRAARLCDAAHGGQVLLSAATHTLVAGHLPAGIQIIALGEHQLRDFGEAEPIFQLLMPGGQHGFPPLRSAQPVHADVPVPRTSLLGRAVETREVEDLLTRQDTRLVTLTGAGGTGKTRLAIAVARHARESFRDGICYVALAAITDPTLVASAIVRRLGLQESGPTLPEELLFGHLRRREMLLVLDNFEHLLPAASLVSDLLSSCPGVRVLVTSRAPLRLSGERDYAVPTLGVPDPSELGAVETLTRFAAVALFVDRARSVSVHFSANDSDLTAIARICVRLDGLPLAIELAAARIGLLTPQEILAQLGDVTGSGSLVLLTGGERDAPSRHRTLRSAIGWSLDLLARDDRAVFARLSVFVGGFSLDAAAAVEDALADCGVTAGQPTRGILDVISTLVENSLLQRVERVGTEARFAALETIREYGIELLNADAQRPAVMRAHASYFAALAEKGSKELGGPHQAEWLARLDNEHPNFRAALTWSLSAECEDRQLAARLATALWVFWFRRAYLREGSRWIEQVHAASKSVASPHGRATLLTADGTFARMVGDFDRADAVLEEAASMWRGLDDAEGLAWALSHLGLVKQWLGELDLGVDILRQSVDLRRQRGEDRGIARSLFHLAIAEDFRGNFNQAATLYEETLEVQQRIGDTWGAARVLGYLAKVLLRMREAARAEQLCRRALTLSSQVSDRWGIGLAHSGLAAAALARGETALAAKELKTSLVIFRDVGARDRVAETVQDLALLTQQLGAPQQSVRLAAGAATMQQASRLAFWPAVEALREVALAEARASIGEAAFDAAWLKGRLMGLEETIEDALAVPDSAEVSPEAPA